MSSEIAIVEEDLPLADATRRLLESSGWASHHYPDGESFLAELERAGPPGCLILNLDLPGISGLTVLRSLARRGHLVPTLGVTDRPGDPVVEQALAAGAGRVLTMPYHSEELVEIVAVLTLGAASGTHDP